MDQICAPESRCIGVRHRAGSQSQGPSRLRRRGDIPILKTSGVTSADAIRVLAVPGSGIFRDGMTVGDFLRGVPNRAMAMQMLARCQRAGTIGFQHRDPEPGDAP